MARRRWYAELNLHVVQVYEASLVLEHYACTCSLHQSLGYDCGHEHTHNIPVRRDQFANLHNMKTGACFLLFICSMASIFAEEQMNSEEMPSIAFLEFLGEWETDDGEWIDPVELENEEIGQLIETTTSSEVKTDNEN